MKKILFSLIAILLLSGCEFNLKENDKDKIEENKITELSKESNEVKNIVNTFISHVSDYEEDVYSTEKISDLLKYEIALNASKDLIEHDSNCDANKYDNLYDSPYTEYLCDYISYIDLNNQYNNLFGVNLPKEEIIVVFGDSDILRYNSNLDIYEFMSVWGSADGDEMWHSKLSNIVASEQDNNNIYIYENVIYVNAESKGFDFNENGKFGEENVFSILYPHNSFEQVVTSSQNSFEKFKQELLTKYLSKFDTYKWTFKKNSNGTYMYESVEYVEQ